MLSRSLLLPLVLLSSTPVLAQAPEASRSQQEVADFRGVSVGQGLHAEVKRGPKAVWLEGRAEDVARIKLVVKDGILTTRVERDASWFSRGPRNVRVFITNPRVEVVEASGGAQVEAEATAVDSFRAEASGGSEVKLSGVESKKLKAEASGGAQLTLRGHADAVDLESSGGAEIRARGLKMSSLEVEASGGSQIEASAEQSIRGSLSSGSSLTATSKPPSVDVERSSGAELNYE